MPIPNRRCDTCLWWDSSTIDDADRSPCRVSPPVITIPGNPTGAWPFTDHSDWCGNWAADPRKIEEDEA